MDDRKMKFSLIFSAVIVLFSSGASAAYVDATPENFDFTKKINSIIDSTPKQPWGFISNKAPNSFAISANGVIRGAQVGIKVPGVIAKMGVAFKYAGNASLYAGKAMFKMSPAGIGLLGLQWLAESCISSVGNTWKFTCGPNGEPLSSSDQSDGYTYIAFGVGYANLQNITPAVLKQYPGAIFDKSFCDSDPKYITCVVKKDFGSGPQYYTEFIVTKQLSSCPAGYYLSTDGCSQFPPSEDVTEQQFVDRLSSKTMPDAVGVSMPSGVYLPIDTAVLNPLPEGYTPNKMVSPTSDPVKVPGSDPAKYTQRLIELTPSPTSDRPFRVSLTPTTEETDSSTPMQGEETRPNSTTTIKDAEQPPNLCETNPDIVACQTLGELSSEEMGKDQINFSITPDSGFGPDNASCPAPKSITLMGKSFSFDSKMICDLALMIRPIIIAFAWLSAAMIFIGFSRKN